LVLELTAKNFLYWNISCATPNRLITREMAEAHIWNYDFDSTIRT